MTEPTRRRPREHCPVSGIKHVLVFVKPTRKELTRTTRFNLYTMSTS